MNINKWNILSLYLLNISTIFFRLLVITCKGIHYFPFTSNAKIKGELCLCLYRLTLFLTTYLIGNSYLLTAKSSIIPHKDSLNLPQTINYNLIWLHACKVIIDQTNSTNCIHFVIPSNNTNSITSVYVFYIIVIKWVYLYWKRPFLHNTYLY